MQANRRRVTLVRAELTSRTQFITRLEIQIRLFVDMTEECAEDGITM